MANGLPILGSNFQFWGHWWLPEHPNDQNVGCLSCSGGNLRLKLLGKFDAINPNKLHATVPVIFGVADGKMFTLWNSIQLQFGLRLPGTIQQHFGHMRILSGAHLLNKNDAQFSGLTVYAANLGPWSGIRPVEPLISTGDSLEISYRMAPIRSREIDLTDHGLALKIGSLVSTNDKEYKRYGFDVSPAISLEFNSPRLFDEAIKQSGSLQRVLSLLIGTELIAEASTIEIDGGKTFDTRIGLLFEDAPPDDNEPLGSFEILVPLNEISDIAEEVFSSWFREEARIRDAVDLYIGTMRQRALPTPTEMTSLAQALETFHRNVHNEGTISFQSRVKELVAGFDRTLVASFGIGDSFPKDVVDARNYFTHWNPKTLKTKLSGADLSNLVSKLKAFTRLVLLSHIGVPPNVIVRRTLESKHLYLPEAVPIVWS